MILRISYLAYACSVAAWAQQGLPDPVFNLIPFEQWLKGGGDAHIRWSTQMFPIRLGVHQRLRVGLSVRIDGEEFVKRSGPEQMVVFIEIRDREDRVFRTHHAMHFDELKNPASLASVNLDLYALILPGDYQVAMAVYDTGSKEHVLKRTKLHVPDLPHDPLPEAWRNLPEVEYVTAFEPPDSWYRPEISSRLYLPVSNERSVRVEVVVNESPTEVARQQVGRTVRRNMENLIPALKVLSEMDIKNGSINVTLLDLERRKVSFDQKDVHTLKWTGLRAALVDNDPNQIDVHALENHEQNAQFFVSEVRKRLESSESNGTDRMLIVLSGPMAFPKGQDLRPIEATPEPGARVYYIRYYPPAQGLGFAPGGVSGRGGPRNPVMVRGPMMGSSTEDSLARTLKPLAPKTFDVTTPMDFRNAVAAIISDISRGK
jgi:hypothetical protein